MKSRIITFAALTALVLAAAAVGAVEFKLPFDAESIAAQAKRKCPDNVKISGDKDVLTVSISPEAPGKAGYDGQYSVNAKKGAGYSADFSIEVKAENLSAPDGRPLPKTLGKIAIGGSSHQIAGDKSDWQTYNFKNVRIPGNGILKLHLTLRNVRGDFSIRNPRAKANIPQRFIDDKIKKKKKKKSKN